jgi:hypothetical protein
MVAALALAIPLVLVGLVSGWQQLRGLRRLRERKLVPSDEAAYLRGRHRRRFVVGALLVLIGGLIAGAFVSGMEARADELGEKKPTDANGEKKEMTDEEKQFVWRWGAYWAGVMALTFALIGLAMADGLASRRYWLKLYREMRDEHNSQLRRDLAVYMQQKEQGRGGGFGGRMGGGN